MRWLVIGGGSIGRQHLAALKAIGEHDLQLVEPNDLTRRQSTHITGTKRAYASLENAGAFDVAIVATPTSLHVPCAVEAASLGKMVVIEKPVSHELTQRPALDAALKGKIGAVSCPMRFHPGFVAAQQIIASGQLGEVFFVRQWYRQHIQDWRPGTDYRDSYSAHQAQGGGLLLDRIHELDCARALFGLPGRLRASMARSSAIETDTDHITTVLSVHRDQLHIELELDCTQPGYQSGLYIVGSKQSLTEIWSPVEDGVPSMAGWEVAKIEQTKHWRDVANGLSDPAQSVSDAYDVLNIALAAYHSANTGQWVTFVGPQNSPDNPEVVAHAG